MAKTIKNDELNILSFDRYFGEMEISRADKHKRIQLAKELESFFIDLLFLLATMSANELYDLGFVEAEYYQKLLGVYGDGLDQTQRTYIRNMLKEVIDTTIKHIDDKYFVSDDRARFIAENEANTYYNYEEYQIAVISGKEYKVWHTMMDDRVRMTHEIVNETRLPITEPFVVGKSQMQYPKDTTMGADPKEYVNCRCSISYE